MYLLEGGAQIALFDCLCGFPDRARDNMIEKFEDALVSAFPPVKIDRAMIDEPTALWHVYDDSDLAAFEGRTWRVRSS